MVTGHVVAVEASSSPPCADLCGVPAEAEFERAACFPYMVIYRIRQVALYMAKEERSDWLSAQQCSSSEVSHSLGLGSLKYEVWVTRRTRHLCYPPPPSSGQCSPKFIPILRFVTEVSGLDRADSCANVLDPPF